MKHINKSGFTLLEIIIVIIIVGVLASLALPRFFSTVEFSRSTEALASLTAVRQSLERCYLQRSGNYNGCTLANLDIENPTNSPNAHFTYTIGGQDATSYTITATRNTRDGGSSSSTIALSQTSSGVGRVGASAFVGLQ
jgi:type IV pilus assembly protein PilE